MLFDLDGVLTPTADLHRYAWQSMFTEVFAEKGVTRPYTDDDYFEHLDGKRRYDGVASMLASRGIVLPLGLPTDPPTADTISGIGNRKNVYFERALTELGMHPYPGSRLLVDELFEKRMPMGVVSSSNNARWVLTAAGLIDLFPIIVDGVVAARESLASKPAPDMFLFGAAQLNLPAAQVVVFEDAISGVAAARAGNFGLVVGVDRGAGHDALRDAGADVVIDDLADYASATSERRH
ncbi:beta-phosphoglucomutase family hydrolase [Okibacterium sp. HSC-33S16]|uniref:HAD family hydrolase n=1 Tax=Okibacterium sp. HSC-33S16 TaxID=2910965 RepID=UPI00209D516D|nr:HAD-IA family hydrolase [Okibacterium sp. HSC-33S16]MCP2031289.1 beta-phosphoglucomutase family hydrolase [Okibacterium sp. HSC-33S16]